MQAIVQSSAYKLLSRFYEAGCLLKHLDSLDWECLQPEKELEDEDGPPSVCTLDRQVPTALGLPATPNRSPSTQICKISERQPLINHTVLCCVTEHNDFFSLKAYKREKYKT